MPQKEPLNVFKKVLKLGRGYSWGPKRLCKRGKGRQRQQDTEKETPERTRAAAESRKAVLEHH